VEAERTWLQTYCRRRSTIHGASKSEADAPGSWTPRSRVVGHFVAATITPTIFAGRQVTSKAWLTNGYVDRDECAAASDWRIIASDHLILLWNLDGSDLERT
jgi:hypothetical protein